MREYIDLNEVTFSNCSLADNTGRIFFWKDRLFRAISYEAADGVKDMFSCGMIDDLVNNNLFPESWITDYELDGYGLVIEHRKIPVVTYPYEWSFLMLKDAAVTVLKTNLVARKYGYQTKDCHGFNIVFDRLQPKYVDLGSFVKVQDKSKFWMGYIEFILYYYNTLNIWRSGDYYTARRILSDPRSMPYEVYLMYKYSLLRFLNIEILKKITRMYSKLMTISSISSSSIKNKMPYPLGHFIAYLKDRDLLRSKKVDFSLLIRKVEKFSRKKYFSPWGSYQNEFYDDKGNLVPSPRFDRIINIIKSYNIESVIELGGNQGVFSRLLIERTNIEKVICTDYDENAVDTMYRLLKKEMIKIVPAVLDFILPICACCNDEPPYERFKSDGVIALAVTHHLLLSQNISIDYIFRSIKNYSKRYVFIEFMPMGLWDGKKAASVPPWYNIEWFKSSLKKYFDIILVEELGKNRVLFFGELRK